MTFTYVNTLATDKDRVRFLLQDNVSSTHELQDEEITYLLTTYGSVGQAALAAARSLHAKYARQVDRAVGDLRISYGQKAKAWADAVDQLESAVNALSPTEIYVGGLSRDELVDDHEDEDLVPPAFERDMHNLDDVAPTLRRSAD